MSSSVFVQIGPLARRSITRPLRTPPLLFSGVFIPVFLYALNVGGLQLATKIPGFPTQSYATFALALPFTFCGIFAFLVAGSQLGEDIRTGYLKRVSLTPLRSGVLLLGQLAGAIVFALVEAMLFLLMGFAVGAHVKAGIGGALAIIAFAGVSALALGSLGQVVALRTRAAEPVQGIYLILIGTVFLSSVNLPRELIQTAWFQKVATFNPISYLVEAPRSLLVTGWDAEPLLLGLLIAGGILITALIQTAGALRSLAVAR